jgi:hypothetical protein
VPVSDGSLERRKKLRAVFALARPRAVFAGCALFGGALPLNAAVDGGHGYLLFQDAAAGQSQANQQEEALRTTWL